MSYTLDDFCRDAAARLREQPGCPGREAVRGLLERLLANPDFVAEHVGESVGDGRHTLYRHPDLDFCVLVHVNENPRVSPPHDHGNSWAIYGQVTHHTDMSEYRRSDDGDGAGPASLERVRSYRLEPGQAGLFDVGAIHAIDYPAGARFVRVTGTDLEVIPRLRYDLKKGEAVTIESATVGSA